MDNLSTVALTTFGIISAISGYVLWSFTTELQSLLANIKDLDSTIPILEAGEKVIVSGLISCINSNNSVIPIQSSHSNNPYAIQILIKEALNRYKNLVSLKSYKTNLTNFTIGAKANIPVKVIKSTIINANKTFEKQEIHNLTWKQSLSSFNKAFEYFTKFTEYIVPDKSIGFIQGDLLKDTKGKLYIKAKEISLNPNKFFSILRQKQNIAWKIFFVSCLGFALALGFKYCRNSENYGRTKIRCKDCGNFANVIVAPCMHLNLCKRCLFLNDNCKDCNQKIDNFFYVTE